MTEGDLNRSIKGNRTSRLHIIPLSFIMSSVYQKKQSEADKKVSLADIDRYGYGLELIETMYIRFKSKNISKTPDSTLK